MAEIRQPENRICAFRLPQSTFNKTILENINPDDPHNTQIDPEFLMQQMQWRETLAQAQAEQDRAALQDLQNEIAQAQTALYQQLEHAFAQQDYPAAGDLVRQGRFLNKLHSEIQNAPD